MLRGKLYACGMGDKIRLYFNQRGKTPESENVPVRIYRRNADEINFNPGMSGRVPGAWTEYIDNAKIDDPRVEKIFEGTLNRIYSFCEYFDTDAEVAHTYIYWVEADSFGEHTILGPTGCKLRDPEVWWGYERFNKEMELLCQEYPDLISKYCYGETTRHKEINGIKVGNRDNMIALAGAIHASEPGPELIIKALRFILSTRPELLNKIGLSILPAINIDMREETVNGSPQYIRKNPNDVDLNRNFDNNWCEEYVYGYDNTIREASTYHGPYPVSENETKAAVRFARETNPLCMFVYDSNSVITEDTMLYHCSPDMGEVYGYGNHLCNIYSKAFRTDHPECGTFHAKPVSYPVSMDCFSKTGMPNGTFEGWVLHEFNVPSFSMQSSESEEGGSACQDQVSRERLEQWSKRHAYGIMAVMDEIIELGKLH